MKYKFSMFNNTLKIDGNYIIYNSLTGGVLGLNEFYSKEFERLSANINSESGPNDLTSNLMKAKMLVPDDLNETDMISVQNNIARFGADFPGLTIAPTLDCNFACPYCYENGRRYHSMNGETVGKLVDFIERISLKSKQIFITWYGGEPLIAMNTIEEISKAIAVLGLNYTAAIVTNGYLLDRKMAEKLKATHVENIQITLDGPKEIHDARRIKKDGTGTFDQILTNISLIHDLFHISVRVNVDKTNIDKVDMLIDSLDAYELKGKVSLYLAPVDNINDTCNAVSCFSDKEFSGEVMNFYRKNLKRGYFFIHIPNCNMGICGAVNSSSFIVDPLGDIYKCWDEIGNKSEAIGTLDHLKSDDPNLIKWLSYNPMTEECRGCSVLPICMGGCPNQVFKKGKHRCAPIKHHLEEFILLKKEIFYNS